MSYGIRSGEKTLTNDSGDDLTNFTIRSPKMFYAAEGDPMQGVLRLTIVHLGESRQVDLDLQNSNLLQQIQQKILTCKIFRQGDGPRIEAHILDLLTNDQAQKVTHPLCFLQHGFHRLSDGTYVFVAGNDVLGLPNDREWIVTGETAQAHLAYDKTLTTRQAMEAFWPVLKRNKKQAFPIWGFTLASSMRSLLSNLNITTFPSCAVIGSQGNGKTTMCQRLSLLYDDALRPGRRWGEIDVKSTEASTRDAISSYRDQVVLLDDMAKSISFAQVRERKDLLGNMLRFASNETDRRKMDGHHRVKEQFCTAGLIFTGEFSLDNPSDITRTITVQINKQLQGGEQSDRVVAATVFRWFILWMLPRINGAVADLAEELEQIQGNNQRLQKNRILILWALKQFLLFTQESGTVTEQEVDKMLEKAIKICDDIIGEQIRQIVNLEPAKNLSYYILDGLQQGIIQRVSEKKLKKDEELPEYYYVHIKDDDYLYMRTGVLYRYFDEQTQLQIKSTKAMDKRLKLEGVIHPGKEGRAADKKIGCHRYLKLRRSDLAASASRTP